MSLTASRLRELVLYNSETGLFFRRSNPSRALGSPTSDGYLEFMVDGQVYKAHRLAWLYVYGSWPTPRADHKNGHRDQNWIGNLREANGQQNAANRRVCGKSGIKGVYRRGRSFVAGIKSNGRRIHLGSFPTEQEAIAAYVVAAKSHFGEFATTWIAPEIVAEKK